MDWILLLGRVLFAAIFVMAGLMFHLGQRKMATEYTRSTGAPAPELLVPLTGIVIAAAGVLIVLGLWMDLAALAVIGFLLPTSYYMHSFWKIEDPQEAANQQNHFMKNLAIVGGAVPLLPGDRVRGRHRDRDRAGAVRLGASQRGRQAD
jgi:putative oxidoreductase